MKTSIRRWLAVACLVLLGAAAAGAQSDDTVTTVPFAFNVGKTVLPRDTYTVSRMPGQLAAFMIRSDRRGVVVLTQRETLRDRNATPSMVFHRYADQYFLREIRLPGAVALQLPKTRAEIDAGERLAKNATAEVVVVPALTK